MDWTKCSERVPEDGVRVLVQRENGDSHAAELDRGVWFNSCNSCMLNGVSHWMPLPEGPKEEE